MRAALRARGSPDFGGGGDLLAKHLALAQPAKVGDCREGADLGNLRTANKALPLSPRPLLLRQKARSGAWKALLIETGGVEGRGAAMDPRAGANSEEPKQPDAPVARARVGKVR